MTTIVETTQEEALNLKLDKYQKAGFWLTISATFFMAVIFTIWIVLNLEHGTSFFMVGGAYASGIFAGGGFVLLSLKNILTSIPKGGS